MTDHHGSSEMPIESCVCALCAMRLWAKVASLEARIGELTRALTSTRLAYDEREGERDIHHTEGLRLTALLADAGAAYQSVEAEKDEALRHSEELMAKLEALREAAVWLGDSLLLIAEREGVNLSKQTYEAIKTVSAKARLAVEDPATAGVPPPKHKWSDNNIAEREILLADSPPNCCGHY